jgi:hypothetical protein
MIFGTRSNWRASDTAPEMKVKIENPKRKAVVQTGRANWYPYYAGFSAAFAEQLIFSSGLKPWSRIVDPWNGSGTTTAAALDCGYSSCGFDLNPAMVVVSKARLISPREKSSLLPIARALVDKAKSSSMYLDADDPLLAWFTPRSASAIRSLEEALHRLLIDCHGRGSLAEPRNVAALSDLAAFFYTSLFRTLRRVGLVFAASNPTWIKLATSYRHRLRPDREAILSLFVEQASFMVDSMGNDPNRKAPDVAASLLVASSEAIPLAGESADLVLSSPPYCTRLDYAVATRLELALLGYSSESFVNLRRSLIGSATVGKTIPGPLPSWGPTCNSFLDKVKRHPSKASRTYYYKSHVQYFRSIWNSLAEINRVLKSRAACFLVVQDSYYKDVHNNLPQIFAEMASGHGLDLFHRADFSSSRTLAGINPGVRQYRSQFGATESVLCLSKTA